MPPRLRLSLPKPRTHLQSNMNNPKIHSPSCRLLCSLLLALATVMADRLSAATPYAMSGGDYSENFSEIANWANNFASGIGADRWGSVAVNATGTIPDGQRTSVSTATFVTSSSGGVQKGSGNIVLLATGSGDNSSASAIDLFLDFTGRNAGTLSFDWAEINNTTGNRASSIKVYTSTDGSTFTELSAGFFTVTNNVAASGTKSGITLPAGFSGSATARIRFYIYNGGLQPAGATGSRPKISLDNIAVTSTAGCAAPTVTAPTAAPAASVCAGTEVILTANASGGTAPYSYQWKKGGTNIAGATSSTFTNTSPVANDSGNYTVEVTSSCGGAPATSPALTVTINGLPASTITAPSGACANSTGNSASVPNAGAGAAYTWSITGGSIDSGAGTSTISFSAGASGTVELTCAVTNSLGCGSSSGASVAIGGPNATITAAASVCAGTSGHAASVLDAGVGATYAWTITGGAIDSGAGTRAITYTAASSGSVALGCTVTSAGGCNSVGNTSVNINALPDPTITAAATVCGSSLGNAASVPDAGPGSAYGWTVTGGNITGGAGTRAITYTAAATGTVSLHCSVTNGNGCVAIGNAGATITESPGSTISAASSTCAGSTGNNASVPDAGIGASYAWTISNGSITAGDGTRQIQFTAGSSGLVTLGCVVTGPNGCASTNGAASVLINTFLASTTVFSENMGVPSGNTVVNSYTGWQNGAPIVFSSSTAAQPDVRTTTASTGYAGASGGGNVFFGTSGGAERSFTIAGINTLGLGGLQLQFGLNKVQAGVEPMVVEVSSDGTTWTALTVPQPASIGVWTWTTASGTIPSTANLRIRFSKNSTTAQYRVDDVKLVSLSTGAAISGPTSLCAGSSAILTASAGSSWSWSNGSNTQSILINPLVPTDYSVTITDANGCSSTASTTVTVDALPSISSITPASALKNVGESVTFTVTASGTGLHYQWRTNGVPISGAADQNTYTINAVAVGDAATYDCVVSGACNPSATSDPVVLTVNRPPVAQDDTAGAPAGQTIVIPAAKLTRNDSDADGDALTVISASGATLADNAITYNVPASGTSGSFSYTISDGRGGTASATVTVTISGNGEGFNRIASDTLGNGDVRLIYRGIPGFSYALDWTHSLTPPISWTPLGTNQVNPTGALLFTNTPSGGADFYRTRHVP